MGANKMKSWSYDEITAETENRIISLMALDRYDWAYGAYILWSNMCMGWIRDGDDERLESLTVRGE
jgi:hypothetical protein